MQLDKGSAQLLPALNTHSLSTVKLKPAACKVLPIAVATVPDYLASFDQWHSCATLLLSLSLNPAEAQADMLAA